MPKNASDSHPAAPGEPKTPFEAVTDAILKNPGDDSLADLVENSRLLPAAKAMLAIKQGRLDPDAREQDQHDLDGDKATPGVLI